MYVDDLGELLADGDRGDYTAVIAYGSRRINVGIIPDDQALETTVRLAVEVVRRLQDLDATAKRIAVRDLRDTYNGGWNEYDEVQEDGTFKSVSNPKLSEEEFERKLSLTSVNVTGER